MGQRANILAPFHEINEAEPDYRLRHSVIDGAFVPQLVMVYCTVTLCWIFYSSAASHVALPTCSSVLYDSVFMAADKLTRTVLTQPGVDGEDVAWRFSSVLCASS